MKPKEFWVSRDTGTDTDDCVMITEKKPTADRDKCGSCGVGETIRYLGNKGIVFGDGGEICYSGWLKLTGLPVEKGQAFKVSIVGLT